VQRAQLRDDKEQKEHAKQARVQKVLSPLPLPSSAQGKQINGKWKTENGKSITFHFPLSVFR
jgi:hypothetical protein